MCYQGCIYENWSGECTARSGVPLPCEAEDDEDYERAVRDHEEAKAEARWEARQDREWLC